MSGILKVNCLVVGDPEGQIFTIKVAATENISALKDLIKIKRDDVVAAKITIFLNLNPMDVHVIIAPPASKSPHSVLTTHIC